MTSLHERKYFKWVINNRKKAI